MTKAIAALMCVGALSTGPPVWAIDSRGTQHEKHDSASVAGRWIVSLQGPHSVSMTLVLEQKDTKVSGTLSNPHGGGGFPVAGSFADGKLLMTVTSGSDMEFVGTLKNDGTMAGDVSTARGDMEWTAKRVDHD
jgi:hypothetical protein